MNENLKYKLLMFFRYFGDALYYPFLSLYLRNTNLIESEIGFILSITPLIGIILNPVYTRLCKNLAITKNILVIVSILEAIFIGIIGFTTNYYVILALVILIAVTGSSHYGLMDSILAVYATRNHQEYAYYRVYGSIAYIFGTSIAGVLIDKISFAFCFISGSSLFIISAIFYLLIKPIDQPKEKSQVHLKRVFTNKLFIGFLVVHVLLMSIINSSDSFYPLFLSTNGVSSEQYGYVYSYFVIFEVITFFVLRKIKLKRNALPIYLFCIGLSIIRMTINALTLPIIVSIIFSSLRGIAFSLVLYVSYQYIVDILGDSDSLTGTMVLSLFTSIFQIILYNVDGILITKFGYQKFYILELILLSIIFILTFLQIGYKKKKIAK